MKKRIALAAIAALAGGLLVAAPASAVAPATAFSLSAATGVTGNGTATVAGTQIAGASNYSTVSETTTGLTFVPGTLEGYLTVTGGTFTATGLVGASLDVAKTTATLVSETNSVNVATPVNGTIVVKYIVRSWSAGISTDTTVQTITITVGAAPAGEAFHHAAVGAWSANGAPWGGIGGTATQANTYYADSKLYSPKRDVNVNVNNFAAWFSIDQYRAADTSTLSNSLAKPVVVSLSGVGTLETYNTCGGLSGYSQYLVESGCSSVQVAAFSDGRAGTAVITVSVGGVVLGTKTVVFYGDAVAFTATIDKAQIQAGGSAILTVTAKDAAGNAVPGLPYAITDETATVGSPNNPGFIPGTETYTVTGASKFAAVITVGNGVVDTKTVVANFVTAGVGSIVVVADKASYAPGEKATFTVTAKNADGVLVGDDSYSLALAGSASFYGVTASPIAFKNGVSTFSAYMPVLQGPVVIEVTVGGKTATLTSSVVDAAAVAQAAAITALQTSVAALTTTVASLVASMTAQIKVINATMLKIQKALAALRASLKK